LGQKVTDTVKTMALPIIDKLNLELVDVEFKKEGSNWFLRVFIDKEDGGIDIDDCSAVSEELSSLLDKHDPISTAYFLEVSSPGAERPLKNEKDIIKAIGKHVHIITFEPINGEKVFEGKLFSFEQNVLSIVDGKINVEIPYEKIASARLAVVF